MTSVHHHMHCSAAVSAKSRHDGLHAGYHGRGCADETALDDILVAGRTSLLGKEHKTIGSVFEVFDIGQPGDEDIFYHDGLCKQRCGHDDGSLPRPCPRRASPNTQTSHNFLSSANNRDLNREVYPQAAHRLVNGGAG